MAKHTAYIALAGNDETAKLNDDTQPFQSYSAAVKALDAVRRDGDSGAIVDLGPFARPKPKPAD